MRVKTIYVKHKPYDFEFLPNFSITGSIKGMKENYYGKNALLVRCGSCIYNVSSKPEYYSSDIILDFAKNYNIDEEEMHEFLSNEKKGGK